MVLQSNFAKRPFPKRIGSNAENKIPAVTSSSFMRHKHSSILRHRARINKLTDDVKHNVEHAARSRTKASKNVKFSMRTVVPQPPQDVEMADATSSSSSSTYQPISVTLPKELQKPTFDEISPDVLEAVDPNMTTVDPTYLRESLESVGPFFYKTLCQVQPPPSFEKLPKELKVTVNKWEPTFVLPSHVLAIFGPDQKQGSTSKADKVMLYPVHSLFLAAHCSRLPAIPSVEQKHEFITPETVTAACPVVPMRLPSPLTYKSLFCYLYTKRADVLLNSLLPAPAPASLMFSLLPMSKPLMNPNALFETSTSDSQPISKPKRLHHTARTRTRPIAGRPVATKPKQPSPPPAAPPASPSKLSQEDEDTQIAFEHRKAVLECSTRLAATYATQALVQHILRVHGLYLNACALGIADEGLWETIGCAWEMLLAAVTIGTGQGVESVLGPEVVAPTLPLAPPPSSESSSSSSLPVAVSS